VTTTGLPDRTESQPDLVSVVSAEVAAHPAADPRELRSLMRTRRLLRWLPHPLSEHADATHVTGSALVLSTDGRLVLHRHKRLGRWLQPGGHLEAGEHPAEAARRETWEETGLVALHPGGVRRLVHVDVHEGPRGHVHLDLRYLLLAGSDDEFAPGPGESPAVRWWSVDEALGLADASLRGAIIAALRAEPRPPMAPAR